MTSRRGRGDARADGHGDAAEGHAVDADLREAEDQQGHGEGEWDRRQGDDGGAEVEEEKEKHHRNHDGPVADRLAQVSNRRLDEVALTEEDLGLDTLWQ